MKMFLLLLFCFIMAADGLAQGPSPDAVFPPHGNSPAFTRGPFVEKYLDLLERKNPQDYAYLKDLMEREPEAFHRELRRRLREQRRDRNLHPEKWLPHESKTHRPDRADGNPAEDPTWKRHRKELDELVLQHNEAELHQQPAIKKALRAELEKRFHIRQKARRENVERIQKELDRIKKVLHKREKEKDLIIDRRLEKLLQEPALQR